MKIVEMSTVKPEEATSRLFEGKVTRQTLVNPGQSPNFQASMITFSPGAKNIFHSHTKDQLLWITEGRGIVATKEEERIVTAGTMIHIPAGELHWHGAVADSSFSHISFTVPGQETSF